jgi:hypothetical protein
LASVAAVVAMTSPGQAAGTALVLTGIALACDDVLSLVAVAILGGVGLAVRIRAGSGSSSRRWAADAGS